MIFLSHNSVDKAFVRHVGSQLILVGEDVFFDEWSIGIGESIPGALNKALADYDTFVLFWSADAAHSAWVVEEYQSAINVFLKSTGKKLVVVRLDNEPVPPMLDHRSWIDARTNPVAGHVVNQIMDFTGTARLIAMQEYITGLDLGFEYFHGYGVAVACERCGAGTDQLEGFSETDYERDDVYAGVRCKKCGWNDGAEI